MIVGYARVSTDDQTLALQLDALQAAGCEKVFRDTISGAKTERPGLTKALEHVRSGDMLVVWRLDRLGRSLSHLIELIQTLEGRGVGFKSLTKPRQSFGCIFRHYRWPNNTCLESKDVVQEKHLRSRLPRTVTCH